MSNTQGYINVLIAAALFGVTTTLNKIVLKEMNPLAVSGLIYLCAGILLSIIRYFPQHKKVLEKFNISSQEKKLNNTDWRYLILIALCGAAIGPFLFLYGLNLSSAVSGSLLLNAEVLFTTIIAIVFLHERAHNKEYLAMLLIFLAAIAVTTNLNLSSGGGSLIGDIFMIGGTLFWAIDNSISKKLSIDNDPLKIASIKSLIGGSISLLLVVLLGIKLTITAAVIPYLLFVGLFGFGISIVLFLSSLKIIGSMKTVVIFSTSAFFGLVTAFLILGESISFVQLLAGVLMIFSIYLMTKN